MSVIATNEANINHVFTWRCSRDRIVPSIARKRRLMFNILIDVASSSRIVVTDEISIAVGSSDNMSYWVLRTLVCPILKASRGIYAV